MSDTRTVKKIFNWKIVTKRLQERLKYRWEDNIKQNICQMKIKNWIDCVQNRGSGKRSLRRSKLSTRNFSARKRKGRGSRRRRR
jgi:hypothetical protein